MNGKELQRIQRLAQMDFMWDDSEYVDLSAILDTLRKEGLYSNKTPDKDCVWAIQRYIETIKVITKELCKRRRKKPRQVQKSN